MICPGRMPVFAACLMIPASALAHSPIEGIGEFYSGLLHPLFVPAHLLLVIASGLFVGQRGAKDNQPALFGFLAGVAVGLVAAGFSVGDRIEVFILAGGAAIGILVVARLDLNRFWCVSIVALAGLLLGMDSTQDALSGKEKFASLFGSGLGLYLLFLYPMALADMFTKRAWQTIGVRVIGSWIAASSLLVLALSFSSVSVR